MDEHTELDELVGIGGDKTKLWDNGSDEGVYSVKLSLLFEAMDMICVQALSHSLTSWKASHFGGGDEKVRVLIIVSSYTVYASSLWGLGDEWM